MTSLVGDEIRLSAMAQQPPPDAVPEPPGLEYPNLSRIGPHFAAVRPDELFEVGLAVFLVGIERRLASTP